MERVWNLIVGLFSQYIYRLEAKNPEIVYNNAITELRTGYKKLKEKAAAVVRRAAELKQEAAETQKQLAKVSELLEAAAYLPESELNLDAAADMVNTKELLMEKLNGLMEDLRIAQEDEKEVTSALMELESEKKKLEAEKDANIGRYRSAQARMEIMERQDGTSITAINESLNGVRSTIKNTIAEANLTKQLQANTLENKVKEFAKNTENQSAKQKFLQMRERARQESAGVDDQSSSGKQLPASTEVPANATNNVNKQTA